MVERCRLCGTTEKLSFEHVPPKAAFNNERAELYGLDAWLERDRLTGHPGKRGIIVQQGSGVRTLCEDCNSRAGALYVREMARWARIGRQALAENRLAVEEADSQIAPSGIRLTIQRAQPGRFIKQMVTMLLAIAPVQLVDVYPDLAAYAREPNATEFPPGMTLYLNLFAGPIARFVGQASVIREQDGASYAVSELAYPPYAYALVIGEPVDAPALQGCDITNFASASVDRRANVEMLMQCGFGHTVIPLDYRSAAAITAERESD